GPGGDEHDPVRRRSGERRGEREAGHAGDERLAAPAAVADGAGREVQRRERQRVGEEDPLLADEAEVEIVSDGRERDDDDARVNERERRSQHRRGEGEAPGPLGAVAHLGTVTWWPTSGPRSLVPLLRR